MQNGCLGRPCLSPDLKSGIVSVAFCFSPLALDSLDVGMLIAFVQQKNAPFFVAVAQLILQLVVSCRTIDEMQV